MSGFELVLKTTAAVLHADSSSSLLNRNREHGIEANNGGVSTVTKGNLAMLAQ